MHLKFKIIPPNEIKVVIPFVKKMAKFRISDSILLSRFKEMTNQNYDTGHNNNPIGSLEIATNQNQKREY